MPEVPVGPRNGMDHACVISCDNVATVAVSAIGDTIGVPPQGQETALAEAISDAFGPHVT